MDRDSGGLPHPVEPVTPEAPRALRRVIFQQFWRDAAFLHWSVPPEAVAPLLPAGTRPDVMDGTTPVGLIGFGMESLGLGAGPPVPYLGRFPEINVRLYSVDRLGRRGIVFLSLDCPRLLPVLTANAVFGLPYRWASCARHTTAGRIGYSVRPYAPGRRPVSRFGVAIGDPLPQPSAADHFLTARWGLHVRARGRTWYLPNQHRPWPLHSAELLVCDQDLLRRSGLPDGLVDPAAPESVLYSPGVQTRFGLPEALPSERRHR
ncbi:DUF2071 domain-containing protein [Streptomyces sp. ACA25]|uniref:YqjF family protein n=1 Tax=Streptomyces sp. ACA25 TaxID=3022596 RepID=UPI0023077CDA|nr:DUF2071 domain-containing protein [Streptomyces sp. ACA25]MDB1086316.1 DUF2071 domain-containing protein [Streptomyces sp. ACA25]